MLIIGDEESIPSNIKGNFIIYNLFSRIEGYPYLNILPPANVVDYGNEQFDYLFANFVFQNDNVFYEFFDKVIYQLYSGYDIYLITVRDIFFDNICESILKLVQQRYGYNGAIINDASDIDYLYREESFTANGVYNLDADKERWSLMYTSQNMYKAPDGSVRIRGYEHHEGYN